MQRVAIPKGGHASRFSISNVFASHPGAAYDQAVYDLCHDLADEKDGRLLVASVDPNVDKSFGNVHLEQVQQVCAAFHHEWMKALHTYESRKKLSLAD
jgi:hypothetical protein